MQAQEGVAEQNREVVGQKLRETTVQAQKERGRQQEQGDIIGNTETGNFLNRGNIRLK